MAAVMVNTPDLLSLKEQFAERLSACKELDNFFCEGARVIDQDADVSRLHKLTASLKELFDKIRLREISEKSQMAGWDMAIEIGHLLATAVGAVNEAHGLVEGADRVIERRAARLRFSE